MISARPIAITGAKSAQGVPKKLLTGSAASSAKQVMELGAKLSAGKEIKVPEDIPEIGDSE